VAGCANAYNNEEEAQMKGAGKYAEELKSLVKKFAKESKAAPLQKQEALRAMVRAIFAFDTTDGRADEALAVIDREFVDLNELRVATELEVHDLIGPKYPQIEKRATMISTILNYVFEKEGVLSFERLAALKKAEIRQFFRDLPAMTPYVEAYISLMSFDVAAMPMDDMSLVYLKQAGAADPEATIEDTQKFVENHLKPEEIYELFMGLRRAAKDNFVPPAPVEEKKKKK
jgi:endonuclease III